MIICTAALASPVSTMSHAEKYTSSDALDILNYIVSSSEYSEKYDANFDLDVNSEDALNILQCVCGLKDSPIPERTDIFSSFYPQAQEILDKMTLEEKVGQLFLLGVDKNNPEAAIKNISPAE